MRPVYLQPVHMEPSMPGFDQGNFDTHLELDIHADKNNPQGFDPGAWIPYLTVSYQLQKVGSDWSTYASAIRYLGMQIAMMMPAIPVRLSCACEDINNVLGLDNNINT